MTYILTYSLVETIQLTDELEEKLMRLPGACGSASQGGKVLVDFAYGPGEADSSKSAVLQGLEALESVGLEVSAISIEVEAGTQSEASVLA